MRLLLIGFLLFACVAHAQLESAAFKPYIFFGYEADSPADHNYGAFHYANIHNTLPADSVGSFYQSGLFHTWYRPADIYDTKEYDRQRDGYHCMEGGAGYKPYLRFRSQYTPQKFTTGAVAGGFGSFCNGPGQGVPSFNRSRSSATLGWDKNLGRYGAAQLSNCLLYPLDGIGFKDRTNNQMLGYGYYALPLTEPKDSTAGSDAPSGNHCWTLFFNTKNFSGPVCFFTPYHWAKYSIENPHLYGRCLDSSFLKVNSIYQRETNVIPGKKWTAPNGDAYYRITPFSMASDDDRVGRLGSMPMTIDSTMWDQLEAWFKGGKPAPASFGKLGDEIHVRNSKGGRLAFQIDKISVSSSNFAVWTKDSDPTASAFKWQGPLVKKLAHEDLVQIPEYYRLKKGSKSIDAIPESDVPKESTLQNVRFPEDAKDDFEFDHFVHDPIRTPLHPDYKYSDKVVDVWKTPGPVAGPFVTQLSDGSQVVYYWYKFNEQPSILNSDMDDEERALIQKRVELLHAHWSKEDHYFPDPEQELASLDEGLIVTPPEGLEVGYVPICVHQQDAGEALPRFKKILRSQ
jgi:hypothetical protein